MSASDIATLSASMAASVAAGDYAGARGYAEQILAHMAALPDVGSGADRIEWMNARQAAEKVLSLCSAGIARTRTGGAIQRSKVTWARPDAEDEDA